MAVFCWSVYNGATYYIDVFGNRFHNELEAMKREVAKWQNSPDMTSPLLTPRSDASAQMGATIDGEVDRKEHSQARSVDKIPLLSEIGGATGIDGGAKDIARERKIGELPA